MTGWIILAAVLLVIVAVSLVRLGGRVSYGPDGILVYVLIGHHKIRLFDEGKEKKTKKSKEKKPKKEKEKKPKKAKVPDEGKKKRGSIGRIMTLLPVVCEAAGAFKRKIRIDCLDLTVIWRAEDAASAALGYGKANALLGMIWPLIDNNFNVSKCNWNVDVDYERGKPSFGAEAAITISVGQLVSFVVVYGFKLLKNWSRSGKDSFEKQEV